MAEFMCMTLLEVVMYLAIGALVTLGRSGFYRPSRARLLVVLLLVVKLVDFVSASVKSFAIRGEFR